MELGTYSLRKNSLLDLFASEVFAGISARRGSVVNMTRSFCDTAIEEGSFGTWIPARSERAEMQDYDLVLHNKPHNFEPPYPEITPQ